MKFGVSRLIIAKTRRTKGSPGQTDRHHLTDPVIDPELEYMFFMESATYYSVCNMYLHNIIDYIIPLFTSKPEPSFGMPKVLQVCRFLFHSTVPILVLYSYNNAEYYV